jgi:signal peptidase I
MTDRHGAGPRPNRVLLGLGAVVGALCLVLVAVGVVAGVKPLVFRSGSMAPEIPAGALALSREVPASDVAVGDVVSVPRSDGVRVTHRVVDVRRSGGHAQLTLQGDANPSPDAEAYQASEAARVFWSVPRVGSAVAFLGTPWGLVLLGGVAALLLLVGCRPAAQGEGRRRAPRAALVGPVIAAAVVAQAAGGSYAAFTDTATVTSAPTTAHTLVAQGQPTCTTQGDIGSTALVAFIKNDARYEYAWELRETNGTVRESGVVGGPASAVGSTVTITIGAGLINFNVNLNVVIRPRLVNAPSWVSQTTTTTPVRIEGLLFIPGAKCGWA